jgi:peptide/nickel transport system permease protein
VAARLRFRPPFENPWDNTQRLLMPALVLGSAVVAVSMRQTRNSMIELLSADYIRRAYAKGLRTGIVVFRHAIRDGLTRSSRSSGSSSVRSSSARW